MERGVYFDAWFPRQHNYHPSLPPRRLRMIDDLIAYRATVLVWSALGGGSISLPYLEAEAWGEIDPRLRMYGFVNDSEFIEAAQAQGIKVFGIVFEVQGWEFPVELNEQEDRILAINELRGVGHRGWLGLREFSGDRYPLLWRSHREYFPNGLVNSDGERVTDLMEECCSRDIHGQPCHAHWVECPDREHYCYTMDRNNPVWREYLKAIIRIQIDAGVAGIQLDEAELPLTTLQYGGCFCKDCMKQFRAWLQDQPPDQRPLELDGVDLSRFHYGAWLLEQGYDFKTERERSPLYWSYIRFQRSAITAYFRELTDYARSYAAEQDRTIEVSGNFFNCLDQYYALEPEVDLIMTEMRNTRYRQPEWYRYVRGFAGAKPVIVVENPYGGIVPELVANLQQGRAYDRFRMSLYEAAALGANMSTPYGSWMGSVEENAFYAPHELCVEIQDFIADHAYLSSTRSLADTALIYSVESNVGNGMKPDALANNPENATSGMPTQPFWAASESLTASRQPYDVRFFPDGVLRPDALADLDLSQYRVIVLPDCHYLTVPQADALARVLDRGGRLVATGSLGANLDPEQRQHLVEHPGMSMVEGTDPGIAGSTPQVRYDDDADLALHIVAVERGIAIHIIRYAYDDDIDGVPVLPGLKLSVRLDGSFDSLICFSPEGCLTGSMHRIGDRYELALQQLPMYGIVLLEGSSV
jgi:hypothetical protein